MASIRPLPRTLPSARGERGRMKRREWLFGLAMLAGGGPARAQRPPRRVGALVVEASHAELLESVLKARGWIPGRTVQVESRVTRGDTDLSRTYARELIAAQPDVLFATSNTSMAAFHVERPGLPT